jgi:preprotein translocase subunit SecE
VANAVVTFAGRTVAYLRDVRAEVRKVNWPTLEDLRRSTTVIVIFVVAFGILIGLLDWLLSKILIDWLGRILG